MLDSLLDMLPGVISDVLAVVLGAVALWLFSYVAHPFAFFRNPNRILSGKWKRYGVGFYPNDDGNRPIHDASVSLFIFPMIAFAYSSNPTYSYFGLIKFANNNIYINWIGLGHSERMMSVFKKPLTVSENTYLIGTKSCIDRNSFPAMNKEVLSKSEMSYELVRELVGKPNDSQAVSDPVFSPASYEAKPSEKLDVPTSG